MLLADTTIWIDHFRSGSDRLAACLNAGEIAIHPAIIVEIALGSLKDRKTVLAALGNLPHVEVASDDEVLRLIDRRALWSRGIGYVDIHLAASVLLTPGTQLWSRDRRLCDAAASAGIPLFTPPAG